MLLLEISISYSDQAMKLKCDGSLTLRSLHFFYFICMLLSGSLTWSFKDPTGNHALTEQGTLN